MAWSQPESMNDSRQLIIHIGNHKTGTTSIQQCLYENRSCLSEQGYSFFSSDMDGRPRRMGDVNTWIRSRGSRIEAALPGAMAELPGNVIVSSENFSWIFKEEQIRKFHTALKLHFSDIKVICYLRRQDLHTVSHYQQASKDRRYYAGHFYARGNRALPPYDVKYEQYLDYNRRLGFWADIFGDSSIRLRVFEKALLKNGDAIDDFFQIAGLEYETRVDDSNISIGLEATKIGHLTNHEHVEHSIKKRLLRQLGDSGKSLPAREEAEAFYRHFRETNRQLNQRFSINEREFLFDEDFTMYPEAPSDIWSEQRANDAIGGLLRGIRSLPLATEGDVVLLRQCAEQLSQSEPEEAAYLEALAARLAKKL